MGLKLAFVVLILQSVVLIVESEPLIVQSKLFHEVFFQHLAFSIAIVADFV